MSRPRPVALVPIALLLFAAGACSGEGSLGRWTAASTPPGPLRGGERVDDTTGNGHHLSPVSGSSGSVRIDEGPDPVGRVLAYPDSGRVALRADQPGGLNPGAADFQVRVTLATDRIDGGANLAQKGAFSTSQYKVQVDGGVASCRFADTEGRAKVWKGVPPRRIDDGAWWEVTCRKTADRVGIRVQRVDGRGRSFSWTDVAIGTITTSRPFMVGAKNASSCDNDQFRGRIGTVVVEEL